MQVCGVIVTYGDRFHLLSQVIDSLLKERINKIVIIDNGSSVNTQQGLKKYMANVILHRFEENNGTAIAFKAGIIKAFETSCEFIWLMDDDTVPVAGSLDHLKDFWKNFPRNEKEKTIALCSYRKDRANFVKAFGSNNPDDILPAKNNFAGFHLKNLFAKISERINPGKKRSAEPAPDAARISAATYGGLFFHKDLSEKIGLPDESYYLYADDFDFTFRITKGGGEIWIVTNSIIHDLESSFYLPAKKNILYHSAFDSPKDSSSYYALRNTVYFSKKFLVNNKFVYRLNKFLFLVFIMVLGILRAKSKRLKLIHSAIKDGENGRLGFNPEYKI
jgi:GT2 family glycosyltransferase